MGTHLAKAELLGAQGEVEESMKYMEQIEELKRKKALAEVCNSIQVLYNVNKIYWVSLQTQVKVLYMFYVLLSLIRNLFLYSLDMVELKIISNKTKKQGIIFKI